MNINNSGKIPDKIKKVLTAISLLGIILCSGCTPSTTETSTGSSSTVTVSEEESTHIPVEESSDTASSVSSSVVVSGENSGAFSSGSPESSSDTVSTYKSSDVSSSETSQQPLPESSSSETPTVSSAESTPDPPPVVVPDPAMPTSPGTQCAVTDKGVIDYSNISQGYISACYTGSRSKVKLRIQKSGLKAVDHDLAADGSVEYFPISQGDGEYSITVFEQVSGDDYSKAVEQKVISVSLDSQLAPFLYPNRYSDYDKNSDCVYKAAELCAGKTGTIDKISAIFEWITDNVTYDHELAATVQKGYTPDPEKTYNSRKGICYDYASLMCAMLRSQSIPTRLVKGYAAPDIYHAWNEVYTEETGWITPELMLKNSGYNIADSTFYASARDKVQIASYISNASNYQVLYYY